jgi:hypothetical protein
VVLFFDPIAPAPALEENLGSLVLTRKVQSQQPAKGGIPWEIKVPNPKTKVKSKKRPSR